VVGQGREGKSTVVSDGDPPTIFRFGAPDDPHAATADRISTIPDTAAPGVSIVAEVWMTDEPPSAATAARAEDPTAGGVAWNVECPPTGTRSRFVQWGADVFAPMHRTDTLDYDVVLSGSVDLLLEDGSEVTMGPGDVVVIPGIVHAWRAGPSGCTMLVFMSGLHQ
jgi:hypothetical protein